MSFFNLRNGIMAIALFCPAGIKAIPIGSTTYDTYPYALVYYYGYTVSDALTRVYEFNRWREHIQSLEFDYTLDPNNSFRRAFRPLVDLVQLAFNGTLRSDRHNKSIYEFDPYVTFRWANFPWNDKLNTSIAIGEGVSYVTAVPSLESKNQQETNRLLNYLMFEATFSSPKNPRLQVLVRVHHRSGAFGLYHADNTGSNDVGFGIRYLFD